MSRDSEKSRRELLQELAGERLLNEELRREMTRLAVAAGWHESRLRRFRRRMAEAEDLERREIAEALHEGLQQMLAAVCFKLSMLERGVADRPEPAARLVEARAMIDETIRYARELSYSLSPPALNHVGLPETLKGLARRVLEDYKVRVTVRTDRYWREPEDPAVRRFVFRAVQELLLNAVRHAATDQAHVLLGADGLSLQVAVWDLGRGFDPKRLPGGKGSGAWRGLRGLRERAEVLGGELEVTSTPKRGTRVVLLLPLDGEGE